MSEDMLSEVRQALVKENWRAVLGMSPENFRYLSATYVPSQTTIRLRHAAAIIPVEGDPAVAVVDIEEGFVQSTSRIKDVRGYNQFSSSCVETATRFLMERGITSGTVGVELDFIPVTEMQKLEKALPNVLFAHAREMFLRLRMIKSQVEITTLAKVNGIAEAIHQEVYSDLKPGLTEKQIEKRITDLFSQYGGDRLVMLAVTSGPRSSYLNASASDRVLEYGDVVRIDIIGTKDGYYSDICRTGVVGKASAEQLEIWEVLVESRRLMEPMLRPGADTADIYRVYSDYVLSERIAPINFVGHGLGLTLHEEPYISKYMSSVLRPGMVMCIEPLYVVEHKFGFQLEDLILITDHGFEYLTGGKKSERILETE